MTCQEATDFLGEYDAGALPGDVLTTFERHLDACPNCREFLVQYRRTIVMGRSCHDDAEDAAAAFPEDLVKAILAALPPGES